MIKLLIILMFLGLVGCEDRKETLANIYLQEKACLKVALSLNKHKWRYTVENGDWLCIISKDGTDQFGKQIVFYADELSTVVRFISIQDNAK